jgi:hypothetical protein
MMRLLWLPLLCLLAPYCGANDVVSVTESVKDETNNKELGMIRYHYDAAIASCSFVLILGVGTFMSVSDYDKVSEQIALGYPIVVVISDHNEGNFQKTSSTDYALLVNGLGSQLSDLIPICSNGDAKIVIGGHSASGEASVVAWQHGLLEMMKPIVGFVGLDPFEISEHTVDESNTLDLPGLFWGFTRTTCSVTKEKAAEAAYKLTSSFARVLYTIHNDNGCDISHCVFTDHGCGVRPLICGTRDQHDWVYQYVAESIHLFLDAIDRNTAFSRDYYQLHGTPEDISFYVNQDEVGDSVTELSRAGSSLVLLSDARVAKSV